MAGEKNAVTVTQKSIYLTFDDGPSEPYTQQILDCLKRYGAQATFFVCGKNVERDPATLKKTAELGHAVGNHAYSHSWLKTFSSTLWDEIIRTEHVVEKIIGHGTPLVRTPWDLMSNAVRQQLASSGYKVVHWDVAPYDWWQPPARYMARAVVGQAFDGCTVLLHDGQKTQIGKSRAQTVEALRLIIPTLQQQGYIFKKLPAAAKI